MGEMEKRLVAGYGSQRREASTRCRETGEPGTSAWPLVPATSARFITGSCRASPCDCICSAFPQAQSLIKCRFQRAWTTDSAPLEPPQRHGARRHSHP